MGIVEYEKNGHMAIIRMNDLRKRNALSVEMFEGLGEAWRRYEEDKEAWVAILTGSGDAFCSGADFASIKKISKGGDPLDVWLDCMAKDPFFGDKLEKPTIVAFNGYCLGGGLDMALKGDLRIAAKRARFQIVEVNLGFPLVLLDNLPFAVCAELVSGGSLSADRAYEVGLVNKVVPDDQLMDAARGMAEELISRPPLAVFHGLKMLRDLRRKAAPVPSNLDVAHMVDLQRELQKSEDCKEAVAAFVEKRKPVFKGR